MADDGIKGESETAGDMAAARSDQAERTHYLERFSKLIQRGKTVLDAGCGDGLLADEYLVQQGLAVNGIDTSSRQIELARRNVSEGFYEVKDMLDLKEGEYCVDGVVSLRAMLHTSREKYPSLLKTFASFMSNGGALLLAMRPNEWGLSGENAHGAAAPSHHDGATDNAELVEAAGFTILLNEIEGMGDLQHQIIVAGI